MARHREGGGNQHSVPLSLVLVRRPRRGTPICDLPLIVKGGKEHRASTSFLLLSRVHPENIINSWI